MGSVGRLAEASGRAYRQRRLHVAAHYRSRPEQGVGRPVSSQAGVAIVGCGLIGQKRAKALGGARLVVCADIAQDRAERLAATAPGCRVVTDWKLAVNDPAVSIVIISTLHDTL